MSTRRAGSGPRAIVVGTDGSPSAEEAVRQAASLAAASDVTLHLVTAYRDPSPRELARERRQIPSGIRLDGVGDWQADARRLLEASAYRIRETRARVVLHAVRGEPATALCAVAEQQRADLLVVGNRPGDGPLRRVRRPIHELVERSAPCSVMVVDTERYWRPVSADERRGEAARGAHPRHLSPATCVLAVATVAVFMALLDTTIVNVAFPAIERTFSGTSLSDLSWVLNAYNVVIAALLVPVGRLADRIGRRRVFTSGLIVFIVSSFACGLAPSAGLLIIARIVQGAGAATLIPAAFAIVLEEFPAEHRAVPTSVLAAAGAVAAATGPSLGGVLVDQAGWRWAFLVNVLIGLALLPALRVLRESRDEEFEGAPDLLGGLLLAGAVGALALGIVKAPDWGWGDGRIVGLRAAAAAALLGLLVHSRRHRSPVIESALLRIRTFGVANAATFVFSIGFYALLLGNILFLTEVWHYSVLTAGFAVTPGPLAATVAAALGGRIVERRGPRTVALPALAGFAVACLLYRGVGAAPDYVGGWLPAQFVSGVSIGLVFAALSTGAVMDLPPNRIATGAALLSCVRQLGAVIGIAGLIAILGVPSPRDPVGPFATAWLLMAVTALVAVAVTLLMPAGRAGDTVREPLRPARRAARVIRGAERREAAVHGIRMSYQIAGAGPAIVLLHGLLEDSMTWRRVVPALALRHTVIVPDLVGHGATDCPADFDYSMGGHAAALRDLLDTLGIERATVVGHSLGGGVAMMFSWLFPDRLARLVLVAPGGLGREVLAPLRILSMPGAGLLLRLVTVRPVRLVLSGLAAACGRLGARGVARTVREVETVLRGLADSSGRLGFLRTTRAVIGLGGQVAGAHHRLSAVVHQPTLVLWGTADRVIPHTHAVQIADHPLVHVVLLEQVGHLPHITQPAFVAEQIAAFAGGEEKARAAEARVRAMAGAAADGRSLTAAG